MNEILKRILRQNWAFYTHRQLYDMVRTEARGAGVLSDTGRAWAEFSALMIQSRQRIDELLRKAGASWEGLAGESMRAGVTPLAQWADDAGTAGEASGHGLSNVGDAFALTSHAMPEPVEVVPDSGFPSKIVHLFGGLTDQDRQTRLAHEAKRRAVELMDSYSSNAHTAVSSLGVFVPPQEISVQPEPVNHTSGGGVNQAGGVVVTGPAGAAGPLREPVSRPAPEARSGAAPGARDAGESTRHQATPEGTGPTTTRELPGTTGTNPAAGQSGSGFPAGAGFSSGLRERLPGPPAPIPGAGSGGGGRHDGGAQRAAGARVAARVGATGTGPAMVPAAAAQRNREEDREHTSPEYLVTDHDEVWDGTTVPSPPVIGAEEQGTREG